MIVSAGPQVVEHPEAGPSPQREANAPTGMSVESTETPTNRPHATGGEMRLTLLLLLFSFFGLGLPRVFTSTAAHTLFIETLAAPIEKGAASGAFTRLVLVCAPHTLGELRAALGPHSAKLVVGEVDKDLAKLGDSELAGRLGALLAG